MVCMAAHQLGGQNFCSASCDRSTSPTDGDEAGICFAAGPADGGRLSGAQLRKCVPTTAGNACGHTDISCLRTDLLEDEGVCMTLTPCAKNSDCRDPVRSVCMGELLIDNYGAKAGLKADNTYCVQFGCHATGAACSPGESCLRKLVPRASRPADICVPNCDANRNCPPNYFCYPDLYSKASPAVCLPGLLGLRCRTRMDCLFGDCLDTGAGFKVCTAKCTDDDDCAKFDSEHGTFFCNDQKICAGPRAFYGGICNADADCRSGEKCYAAPDGRTKVCLFPCDQGGTCKPHGGVPHLCMPQLVPGNPLTGGYCYPGELGLPCRGDEECIKGLQCRQLAPMQPRVCTAICLADEDCQRNRFARFGYCEAGLNVCRRLKADDTPCDRDAQCESKRCITTPAGTKQCDKTPGY
jgi:hypothetical protein